MGSRGENTPEERRRHVRAGVPGTAVVHLDGVSVRGNLANLSIGGALVVVADADDLPQLEDVTLELDLGDGGRLAQRGVVRRRDARRLAIAFVDIVPELAGLIEREVSSEAEAARSPRVVVVDSRRDRRQRVAEKLREAGCTSVEAATPLEAIALVEQRQNRIAAVAVADALTQTGPQELVEFLSESNPEIKLATFADALDDEPVPHTEGRHRRTTSEQLAESLASELKPAGQRERP
jgi:CheY-like chemotaxis protein